MQQRRPLLTTPAILVIALSTAACKFPAADAAVLRRNSRVSNFASRDGWATYVIASFPSLRQVNYAKLGDNVWRPLVLSGLVSPKAVCVDQGNSQLFVSDESANTVFLYHLQVEDGTLKTDGRQYVAAEEVLSRALACDGGGNIYIAGRSVNSKGGVQIGKGSPGKDSTEESVMRQDGERIASGVAPQQVWTQSSSGTPSRLSQLGSIAVDSTNLYWGNTADGATSGSVIKARRANSASIPEPLTFDARPVRSIALTPDYVFYGTEGWIYGVRKYGKSHPCDVNDVNSAVDDGTPTDSWSCYRIAPVTDGTGMAWNGDGTLFVADSRSGAILSLPSGSTKPHTAQKELVAPGVYGIALFQQAESAACPQSQTTRVVVLLQFAVSIFGLSRVF